VSEVLTDCRVPFATELIALAHADERIVAVCNDSVSSSNLVEFQTLFPNRLFNVGIAEQNMVGVGAGLANAGLIPFVCAASPFLTGRATEQIKADVAYSRANVKLVGMSPGVSYGELGPTHHSIEDLAWMRAIDGLPIVTPADASQTREAVSWAASYDGGVFLRVGRFKVPDVSQGHEPAFVFGSGNLLRPGTDVTIVATGVTVSRANAAVDLLANQSISARLINISTISPLDAPMIIAAARETGRIVVAEESVSRGGLGGAIAELLAESHPVPMRLLGVNTFAPTGSVDFLLEHFGLSAEGIAAATAELVARG
jgi:transketolase